MSLQTSLKRMVQTLQLEEHPAYIDENQSYPNLSHPVAVTITTMKRLS